MAAVLNDTNLQQHVTSATHYRDNILDLVITPVTDSIVTDVSVESLLTDHHIIVCKLVSNKPRPIRKEIIYRNIAAIDKQTFAHDLCDTQLVTTPADDIVTLCDQYKSQLLALIDDHAPLIRRTVNVRARQPWRNDELQRMRQHVRQAERKWRHTRLVVHRQIYTNLRDTFKHSISSAKSDYYCAKIESSSGNTKQMYHITNDLMGRTRQTVLPKCDGGPAVLAESFVTFFIAKIVDICSRLTTLRNLNQSFVFEPTDYVIEDPLCDFTLATSDEVISLVMKGTSTFSPDIDVIPTTLLKANIGTLAPVLTRIVKMSIESSTVPKVMKHAVVTPLLKKTGLDPDSLSNYRPISNLSFISKLLERIIASQIRQYMVTNDIFDVFQSAYRPAHSCETALVRIQNDILVSLDNRKSVILVLLDLSAAFDTVDHPLLLDQLYRIGIRGNAHRWMKSYLSERTQLVRVGKHTSRCVYLCSGVPQGSVLGPLLFSIYCLGLDDIFKRHQLQYHMYADDTQLYVEFPRDQQVPATAATNRIALCTADVKTWMASHNFLLNEQKTEVVVIAAPNRSRVHRPVVVAIDVCGVSVMPKPSIRDIGVEIDDTMSMAVHVRRVCQVAYCHIRSIAKIRKCLTTAACKTIVHAFVMSRVDYDNALLFGLPEMQLHKLQMIQNSAARLVTGTHRRDHITPVLFKLHWLPVRYRIEFKLLVLVYQAVHHLGPAYLTSLVKPYAPTRSLRSAAHHSLTIPRYNLERDGRRAFSVAGPSLWNNLPVTIREAGTLTTFKSTLKTHLFRIAFKALC